MTFEISPLPRNRFEHLFALSDAELAVHGAMRLRATSKPGFPCRISLADAEVGEEVILAHYEHQSADSPFRASHAVYLRPQAAEASPAPGEVPEMLRSRILSLRAFDAAGMLVAADLAEGDALEAPLAAMLDEPSVAYVHLHFAKPGCFAARADRVAAATNSGT
jgi:hypothetical protein